MNIMLSLPPEVLAHICLYLVPSNHTFLLNARALGTTQKKSGSAASVSPSIRRSHLLPENEATPEHPATVFSNCKVDIFTLLTLSSTIHPHVINCLYSNNIFYPPDLTTLFCLRETLSSQAIACIRTIRVDACGPATCFFRGYNHFYGWSQLADMNVARIVELFPGIRELRLGGVGPSVVMRRAFTYRGSMCVRDTEVNDVWTKHNILLISRIIGASAEDTELLGAEEGAAVNHHALRNGRVFCMRYDEPESSSPVRGSHRLYGTRIVRRGEFVRPGPMEQEVVDVSAAVARAIAAQDEFKALGLNEVSVYDIA